jgi:A/G-specific adenine glycosylase
MPDLPAGLPAEDRATARAIARWFRAHARPLPWRREPRDPWLSLMSEILLQQTQVARIAERFDQFARRFASPAAMAAAPLDDVLALWSGLGYYRRARLLHACAAAIVERHGGAVPTRAEHLHALPGVGRYTAGAVASIVFARPEPLVDGNVTRVLLRLHGLDLASDGPGVQTWAWQRAAEFAAAADDVPGYSEGVMELGATVCTPRAPRCAACPLAKGCAARRLGIADQIPRPKTRATRTPLAIAAIVVTDRQGRVLLEPRPTGGLWGGLWQPPSLERDADRPATRLQALKALALHDRVEAGGSSKRFSFSTTHRDVTVAVWPARALHAGFARRARGSQAAWLHPSELAELGLGSAQRRMLGVAGIATAGPTPGQPAAVSR